MCDVRISFLSCNCLDDATSYKEKAWNKLGQVSDTQDLDFADDLALLSAISKQMQHKTDELVKLAAKSGLRVSKSKTKIMQVNYKAVNDLQPITKGDRVRRCQPVFIFRFPN